MGCAGEEGTEVYIMSEQERLANMARLSLEGKLSLAQRVCDPWFSLIPYYDWNPNITKEEFVCQIPLQLYASPREILMERVLSIMIGNYEKTSQLQEHLKEERHARCQDIFQK